MIRAILAYCRIHDDAHIAGMLYGAIVGLGLLYLLLSIVYCVGRKLYRRWKYRNVEYHCHPLSGSFEAGGWDEEP